MRTYLFAFLFIVLVLPSAFAANDARGINPADNLTKLELLPQLRAVGDSSVSSLTFKYDHAFRKVFGVNAELPIVRYSGHGFSENGIGDLTLRARAQHTWGRHTLIGATEFILPTATADVLGIQQYTFDPILGYVYSFGHNIFGALVAKQFISLNNTDPEFAPDVNQGQYRMLVGYASNSGWWVLADPQVWVNFETGRQEFLAELELGTMLNKTSGVWLRAGHRLGGNWTRADWTILMGIRFMQF